MDIDTGVLQPYSEAARKRQDALCCPVSYDADLLRQFARRAHRERLRLRRRSLTQGPLRQVFTGIEPANAVPPRSWCKPSGTRRPAAANKGARHAVG